MISHATASSICPNCSAATSGNYCSACGQETRLHVPSAAEFFHEFVGHYIALEGKLWHTLWLLVSRPGKLTADYIAGRRARYVAPLRVYLSLSLLFFALLKFGPVDIRPGAEPAPAGSASAPAKPAQASTNLGQFNPKWEERVHEIDALPPGQGIALMKSKFFAYVPSVVFLIMRVFALYLKLLYRRSGRRYGEHMLFALHSNGFAFLMLGTILLLLKAPWLALLPLAWLVMYLPLALRHVYGGTWQATIARWIVLMVLYGLSVVVAIVAVLFITTIIL